jgi:hypothetical protein
MWGGEVTGLSDNRINGAKGSPKRHKKFQKQINGNINDIRIVDESK